MNEPRTISKDVYWQALARFVIATQKAKELTVLDEEMNELLGQENGSHFSDALYSHDNAGTEKDFKRAMLRSNITVEK